MKDAGNGPGEPLSLTILYAPPRAHESREELIERARNLNFNQPWTSETKIVQRRMRLAEIPIGARICLPDLTRLGGPSETLAFLLVAVLERKCEIWMPGFRISTIDQDYAAKRSVLEMFAAIKRQVRSIAVTEGLFLSRQRGVQPNRKTISTEQAEAIRQTYHETKSLSRTAKAHGVSKTSVWRCIRGGRSE